MVNYSFLAFITKVTGSIFAFFAKLLLPCDSIISSSDSSIISSITNPALAIYRILVGAAADEQGPSCWTYFWKLSHNYLLFSNVNSTYLHHL